MMKKFYSSAGPARKCMTLMLMLAAMAAALPAKAVTTYSNITIGNFVYNLYKADNSNESSYAYCLKLSAAGASVSDLTCPGYVTYNGERYRVDGLSANGFQNLTNLKVLRIGYGVKYIQHSAFKGCTAMTRVYLPSSIEAVYSEAFAGCSSLAYVQFAGDVAPLVYPRTFENTATTKYLSCATYRGMNSMKADGDWNNAFTQIGHHLAYYAYDFTASYSGTTHYYVIRNGIPYNGNTSDYSKRSICLLVGASVSSGTATVTLTQNMPNTANNAPGYYKFYGVADSAFMNMTHIGSIVDNSTMGLKIGRRAFYNCTNLTSAQLRVDSIDAYAFYNCTKLASVDFYNSQLGQGLKYLGGYAFGQTALTSVTIPKTTTQTMGYAPFYNCQSLTAITVDENNTAYSSYRDALYNKAQTWLYQIPGKWTYGSYIMTDGQFPQTLKRVLMYAGAYCSTLTNLHLNYGVTTIDDYAFNNCTKLEKVRLPSSLTPSSTVSVSDKAFTNCSAVKYVYMNYINPPIFDYFPAVSNKSNIALYTPYDSQSRFANSGIYYSYNRKTGTYDHCACWDFESGGIFYTVISNSPYSHNGVTGDGQLSVSQIGIGTHAILPNITYAGKKYVPTEIGYRAANDGRAGININQAYSITTIKPHAFDGMELTSFTFSMVEDIQEYAFRNCKELKENIGTNYELPYLKYVRAYAFDGSGIKGFKGKPSLIFIGRNAFARTSSLNTIDISACTGITKIYQRTFGMISDDPQGEGGGYAHETVKLPNTITEFEKEAFYKNILTTFNFPANLKIIGYRALYDNGIPGEIELPYGVTTIEENALSGWLANRIVLPASVTSVHSRFYMATQQTNALKTLVINKKTPLVFSNEGEDINITYQKMEYTPETIYVPVNYAETWKNDPRWSIFKYYISEGSYDFTGITGHKFTVLSLSNSGMGTCEIVYNPSTYNISNSIAINAAYDKWSRGYYITSIGDKCFYNATNLNTVYLDQHVQRIGSYAFYGSNLAKINNEEALNGETPVSNGFIRTSVNTIGSYAFNNCKNLHELFLPHIEGRNTLSIGSYFFGNNASDFKCWVDYRRLGDFVGSTSWDNTKVYPHLLLDSEWQSFACVKPINFQGTNVEAYTVTNYSQSEKKATLSNVTTLAAGNGGVVHGNANGTYYRLNYGTGGTTSAWLEGLTASAQTVNSSSSLSYFKLNATKPQFDKITTSTTIGRGYAYLKLNTGITGGATTIITNLSGSSVGVYGDVNGDGFVTSADVTAVYDVMLGTDYTFQSTADVNGDGFVTSADVTAVYDIMLGS